MFRIVSWLYRVLILFCAANLAQIAFESVVSVVNSLHNSQELAKDHQGRNCLLATYLYFVFRLPDTQHEIHTTGTVGLWHHLDRQWCNSSPIQNNPFFVWNRVFSGFGTYSVVVCHWAEAYVHQAQEVWWLTQRADTALWLAPRPTRSASCCFSHAFVPAATLIYQHRRAQRTQRSITF